MVDHGCSKIVSKTIPVHVAKCGGDHVRIPTLLKMLLFKGCGVAAAFPSEGRSLNSRGGKSPVSSPTGRDSLQD